MRRSLTRGNSLDNRLFGIWRLMHYRCENPKHKHYQRYGGRGISVCKEWDSFVVFAKWSLENGYKNNLSLDRTNNDGNYEPSNCRWVSFLEQARNRSSGCHTEINGKKRSFSVMKRGSKWQYRIEGTPVNGKRVQISKCGFATEEECIEAAENFLKSKNKNVRKKF